MDVNKTILSCSQKEVGLFVAENGSSYWTSVGIMVFN
jgi:hypothetical protein